MIQFNLYVGKILYKTTFSVDDAFRTFEKWRRNGANVRMQFLNVEKVTA
tara:strand:+ start:416 stop:562 length:147 start_codon:yes stop_codon:yes gene_type:complete